MSHRDGTPLPATLDGVTGERLIKIDRALFYLVGGALAEMVERESLEQTGTLTVDDARAALSQMLWDFYHEEIPVDNTPIGSIMIWPSLTPPAKFLLCSGASHARADYPLLYDALDSIFHVDADNFFTPALGGRFVYGAVEGALPISMAGGLASVTLNASQIPSHVHALESSAGVDFNRATGGTNSSATGLGVSGIFATAPFTPLTSLATGGGGSHENMPPWRAMAYIIRAL